VPIATFQIDQAGKVLNLKIKRSSGSRAIDECVLDEIKRWKYTPSPCGITDSYVVVNIDWGTN